MLNGRENTPVDDCASCTTDDSDASIFQHSASHDFQIQQLTPARALAASGIDLIVWGRDALEFAHCIAPEELHCHLLVADESLLTSARVLGLLGYSPTAADPERLAFANCSPDQPDAYQDSIRLRHCSLVKGCMDWMPSVMLLTPMSYYHVDSSWCKDRSKTHSLAHPAGNRMLRFPTWSAYLDSLIATYLEPRHGRNRVLESNLRIDIMALIWSRLKKKDRSGVGKMSEAEEVVLCAVRKENQLFVKWQLVFCIIGCWEQWRNERRRILTGKYEVSGCSCKRCAETERVL